MSEEEQTKILDKVKKLLALGESPNESEASAAISKAHELLKQYNLDMSDVEVSDSEVLDEIYLESGRTASWKIMLMMEVTKTNFTGVYKSSRWATKIDNVRNVVISVFHFVGKPQNVAVSKVMMDYLFSTIDRLAKNRAGMGKSDIESFKAGIADSLIMRLRETRKKDLTSSTQSRDLVVQEDNAVAEFFEKEKMQSAPVKSGAKSNWDAYAEGRNAGDNIGLNSQIGGNSSNKVAIGK